MVQFLKDVTCMTYRYVDVGNWCCSGWEADAVHFFENGEKVRWEAVDLSNLQEGVDFIYLS